LGASPYCGGGPPQPKKNQKKPPTLERKPQTNPKDNPHTGWFFKNTGFDKGLGKKQPLFFWFEGCGLDTFVVPTAKNQKHRKLLGNREHQVGGVKEKEGETLKNGGRKKP